MILGCPLKKNLKYTPSPASEPDMGGVGVVRGNRGGSGAMGEDGVGGGGLPYRAGGGGGGLHGQLGRVVVGEHWGVGRVHGGGVEEVGLGHLLAGVP